MSVTLAPRPTPAARPARGRHALPAAPRRFAVAGPASLALSLAFLAMFVLGLVQATPTDIDGYGLIAAFPPAALGGLAGIVAVLAVSLCTRGIAPVWLYLQVTVLVVALAIGPAIIEPLPRFATAWAHAGFSEYIARSGQVLHATDARFSWPAFFAAAGFFAEAIGVRPLDLLRWTPAVLGVLYLVPLSVIVRCFLDDQRQRVLAVTLFVLGNWVGQDYFAPQGFNFLLFLVLVAIVLRLLSWGRTDTLVARFLARVLRRDPSLDRAPSAAFGFGQRVAVLVVVLTLYVASVVSHQLTQFFTLFAVGAIVLLGRCRVRWMVTLFAVLSIGYFVWGAQDFWFGHLRDITANLGSVGSSLHENVTARAATATVASREVVVRVRLGLSAVVILLALLGLLRSRRRVLVVPALLAAAPVFVIGLQSYGGEAALRVYFFALPWLAILGAHAINLSRGDSRPAGRRALRMTATAVAGVALSAAFLLARYGNEDFEQMRPADVAAAQEMYRVAPAGASLFALSESVPWRDHDLERYVYAYAAPPPLTRGELPKLLEQMRAAPGGAYLLLTDGQWSEIHYLGGVPADRVEAAQEMYRTAPELRRIYGDGDVGLYVLADPAP